MKSILDVYSEIVKNNPPWTAEEEKEFIEKWWSKDREYFVNEAMKHNLALVFKTMQTVAFNPKSEDVFQRAVSALVEALRRFNPSTGTKISTWVASPVRWAIMQFQNPYNHQGSIRDEITSLNNRYGKKMRVMSIDKHVDGDDDSSTTVGDLITEEDISSDYIIGTHKTNFLAQNELEMDIKDGVAEILEYIPKALTENEQYVIKRMLCGKNMTEISVELKLTRMRISQITANAFEKIRRSKVGKKLKGIFG